MQCRGLYIEIRRVRFQVLVCDAMPCNDDERRESWKIRLHHHPPYIVSSLINFLICWVFWELRVENKSEPKTLDHIRVTNRHTIINSCLFLLIFLRLRLLLLLFLLLLLLLIFSQLIIFIYEHSHTHRRIPFCQKD